MNRITFALIAVLSLLLVSCTSITGDKNQLSENTWELESITGPRITFEGLFPDQKPVITFNSATKTISGKSGCNGYQTKYTLSGKKISFAEPEMSTMMYCGDGETVFRKTMQQIDHYTIEPDGKLALSKGDVIMMRFRPSVK